MLFPTVIPCCQYLSPCDLLLTVTFSSEFLQFFFYISFYWKEKSCNIFETFFFSFKLCCDINPIFSCSLIHALKIVILLSIYFCFVCFTLWSGFHCNQTFLKFLLRKITIYPKKYTHLHKTWLQPVYTHPLSHRSKVSITNVWRFLHGILLLSWKTYSWHDWLDRFEFSFII